METTLIEWCDSTFNPWIGCTKVSPGCANCYAATQDKFRSWTPEGWGAGKPRKRTSVENWKLPLRWNREAFSFVQCSACSWRGDCHHKGRHTDHVLHCPSCDSRGVLRRTRPRVFCASLADWLDDEVPIEWLVNLLETIHATPNLDWLLLTKRPELWQHRMDKVFQFGELLTQRHVDFINWIGAWSQTGGDPIAPQNVWIGTTVENQEMADERIPLLLNIPAKVRFLSCEPLLGPVWLRDPMAEFGDGSLADLTDAPEGWDFPYDIHWIIAGGESGPGCRPFDPEWSRSLRDQCQAADVAFFMKQMGGLKKPFTPIPDDLFIRQFPPSP